MNFTEQDLQKMLSNLHVKEHGKTNWRESGITTLDLPASAPNRPANEPLPKAKGKTRGRQPNKTEMACMNWLAYQYPGQRIRFEAVTFHLENKASYTPDLEVVLPDGNLLYVEVKNSSYRHASYGRSKIAFADARLAYPCFQWRWLELDKGVWITKDY